MGHGPAIACVDSNSRIGCSNEQCTGEVHLVGCHSTVPKWGNILQDFKGEVVTPTWAFRQLVWLALNNSPKEE